MAVEAAEPQVEMGDGYGGAGSGAGGVFCRGSREMGLAHAAHQGEPRCDFEFVLEEKRLQAARDTFWVAKVLVVAPVVEQETEDLVVVLSKAIEAKLNFVSGEGCAERGLTSRVARAVVITRADGIIWPTVEIGAVGKKEKRSTKAGG